MNKLFAIILVFTLISCRSEKTKEKVIKSGEKDKIELTEITIEEEAHDFGELKSGEIVVYSFVFTNTGEHNLIINNVETDCNCVQVKYSKEPIKAGEKGVIEVEFDSSGMFGRNLRSIEIQSNCKEPKHLVIFATIENEQIEFNS